MTRLQRKAPRAVRQTDLMGSLTRRRTRPDPARACRAPRRSILLAPAKPNSKHGRRGAAPRFRAFVRCARPHAPPLARDLGGFARAPARRLAGAPFPSP